MRSDEDLVAHDGHVFYKLICSVILVFIDGYVCVDGDVEGFAGFGVVAFVRNGHGDGYYFSGLRMRDVG